jgi:dTDP-4-amino-4,6-dideoxygalactose transaminase
LPVAEALADEVLSLPVFPEMTPEERAAVKKGSDAFFQAL